MNKPGRNDPCPCGSGQKYKRCCLEKDEAQAREERVARNTELNASVRRGLEFDNEFGVGDLPEGDDDDLVEDSNAVIDLIDAGQLDDAEHAARELLTKYPYVHDGFDRLGMVYEARGDRAQAAHWYRQCLEFVRARPQFYEPAVEERYERFIAEMESPQGR